MNIHIVVTMLIMMLFVPTTSAFFLPADRSIVTSDGTRVEIKRTYTNRDRAALQEAIEIYREYLRQGRTGLVRPTITDPESINRYLLLSFPEREQDHKVDPLSTNEYVKKPTEVTTIQEATHVQRATLRRFIKTGRCVRDDILTNVQFEFCLQAIVGRTKSNTSGLSSDTLPRR